MTTKRECRCGCEHELKPGRNYRSGHDRRHVEALVHRYNTTAKQNREGVRLLADAQLSRALYFEFERRVAEGAGK